MYSENNVLLKKTTNLENLLKESCNFEKDSLFKPLQCLPNASN